jgi:hypothetical protein
MALREKFPTESVTENVRLTPLDVPVMVSELVPLGVVALVITSRKVVPKPPGTEGGVKLAVAPVGKPVTVKLTGPAKPLTPVTVTS